ncbi:hypothetical protein [Roseovarius sp. MMSF_3281]|uniref:hypothetical protein n=1 Tax=Roseovarius sp. MMSF_3281 TaxID=3046694 RepID=UPI00273EE55E|nr:hypothetical protein [Roseovarius sp. MMSF_3281]
MADGGNAHKNSADNVDYEELQSFLDELGDKQHSVSEATGSLRSRIKGIIDEKGWNNAALATIRTIENKSETARADFMRTFLPMFEAMLEHKWREEMHDMLDGVGEDGPTE